MAGSQFVVKEEKDYKEKGKDQEGGCSRGSVYYYPVS